MYAYDNMLYWAYPMSVEIFTKNMTSNERSHIVTRDYYMWRMVMVSARAQGQGETRAEVRGVRHTWSCCVSTTRPHAQGKPRLDPGFTPCNPSGSEPRFHHNPQRTLARDSLQRATRRTRWT